MRNFFGHRLNQTARLDEQDRSRAVPAESIPPMISVTIDSSRLDIGPHWSDLVRRASSNVFMNPAALDAAAATSFADIKMLLAWDEEGASTRRLVGVWALRLRRRAPFWPRVLEALPYNYAFLSSPVVDPARVSEVMPAFFAAIEQSPHLPNILSLRSFSAEYPSYRAIMRELAGRGVTALTLAETARPVATRDVGVKRSGSTRKKLRQDWNRLAGLGPVDVVNDRTPEGAEPAFETFLALEHASWKGQEGTALLSNPGDAAFVRRLLQNLARQGNASVALLRLDGKAIAAQVLMYCGETAYTWKTAFDASFGKYSPGALLIDKVTQELLSGPEIHVVDSCAAEASFMGQLWAGRRPMVDLLFHLSPEKSLGYWLEAGRQLGYQRLRTWRDRLQQRSPAVPARNMGVVPSP
jgi:CelD/BcsL family acetyltransferase involved in cellulose biosynthesis